MLPLSDVLCCSSSALSTDDRNLLARSYTSSICKCDVYDDRGPQVGRRPAPVPTLACSSYYPREGVEFRVVVSDVQPQAACCLVFRCPPDGSASHSSAAQCNISLHNTINANLSLYMPWRRMQDGRYSSTHFCSGHEMKASGQLPDPCSSPSG